MEIGNSIQAYLVPGQNDISGNDLADKHAKEAAVKMKYSSNTKQRRLWVKLKSTC